ncbi:MAG: DUF4054 domain-containing protein [Holosporaceae bacterium]|jgi:hypothetical protein|nr:DUF4054 domain-containing protein [Holosporaceae bacterium]
MTPEEFKAQYPQFEKISDDVITRHLNDFLALYNSLEFKDRLDTAEGLYTAHWLTVENSRIIDKDNISNALIQGTFLNSEKTPEFEVGFSTPDYSMKESSTAEITKTLASTALAAPIDKFFKPSLGNAYIPSELYGQKFLYLIHADLYKSTIYGNKLVYLLYQVYQDDLSQRQLDEKLKEYELLKAEVERRKKAPLAILV